MQSSSKTTISQAMLQQAAQSTRSASLPTGTSRDLDTRWAANDGFAVTSDGSSVAHTPYTRKLLEAVGGPDGIVAIITLFYTRFHADTHIRQFLGGLQQPLATHARRLGLYISEMMGASDRPWHADLRTRERTPIRLADGRSAVVVDRFSAHHCAWNSVDRPKEKVGRRFKLDDCRVWMRLFFWAVRDAGYDETTPLFRYLQKFIAHFIAIYEGTARPFAVVESKWSSVASNLAAYSEAGNFMRDVVDVPFSTAVKITGLPTDAMERVDRWLYSEAPVVDE